MGTRTVYTDAFLNIGYGIINKINKMRRGRRTYTFFFKYKNEQV